MTAIAFAGTKFVADTGIVNRDVAVGETNKIVVKTISSYHYPECPEMGNDFLGVLVFAVAGNIEMRSLAETYIKRELQLQLGLSIYDTGDDFELSSTNPFDNNSAGIAVYVSAEGQIRSFYITSDGMTENTRHDCIAASYGATYFMLGVALGEDLESLMARVVGRATGIGPNYQVVDVLEEMKKARNRHPYIVDSTPEGYTVICDYDAAMAYRKEKELREKEKFNEIPGEHCRIEEHGKDHFRPFRRLWKGLTSRWNDL